MQFCGWLQKLILMGTPQTNKVIFKISLIYLVLKLFICILFVVLQILQVDTRVRHNEELLGPLRSIEAPQDEFGRAARRGRIDILGLILKKRIAHLRRAGQAELVFLVDSSASVGSDNFYNEIKFIRKVFHYFYYTGLLWWN